MIVLAAETSDSTLAFTPEKTTSQQEHKSSGTLQSPTPPLNRKFAVAIVAPLCFLFLLAVLGIVLYCTRRQRPLRQGTGGRRRSQSAPHRSNFHGALATDDAEIGHDERGVVDDWPRPITTGKRSDDGLSRITEMPSHSDESRRRDRLRELPLSPPISHQQLPSSLVSTTETIDALDSSSDDLAGHFSGLDEDPFSDRAAITGSRSMEENSPAVPPSSRPVQRVRPISTGSVADEPGSRSSSDDPVTSINTDSSHSIGDGDTGQQENAEDVEESSSGQGHPYQAVSRTEDSAIPNDHSQQVHEHFAGRSNSVGAAELKRNMELVAHQDDPVPNSKSRSTEVLPPARTFSDVFGAPSSVPAPPLSNRGSWLEDRQSDETESSSPVSP
ncbi:hypothetical protein Slin15195_G065410 [Septoria linicola]|uniref:Uncharacterized protein n=1 Tax=Septoria linicola TaxID=215465 RepID=A0A9Q9EKF3_9PEZI|nr:hypothetical protein Slin14017_G115750 [Septoria linicola]USW53222.1 hypothetical protein Slin15195_G065410 [Septoria linicola]